MLNHPTRRANPLRSTRKPLPPLSQPPLLLHKPPPPSHYDAYLKSITPLYEGFLATQASASSATSLGEYDLDQPGPSSHNLTSLDTVPSQFFEPSFDLSDPSIWSAVINSDNPQRDALSIHLDTLESHLIHEITLRSTSFFSALSNLQDLHSESASCLSRISDLQDALQEVGEKQALKGIQVLDTEEELRVLRVTEQGVHAVSELEELLRVTKGSVEAGDWAGGLGCLGDMVRWWEGHGSQDTLPVDSDQSPTTTDSILLPLSTLPALVSTPIKLLRNRACYSGSAAGCAWCPLSVSFGATRGRWSWRRDWAQLFDGKRC